MKLILNILLLIGLLFFNSCDILRSSLFEVISWSPGDGYHSEPENIDISLVFSHEPHKASVERNFSVTADGNRVRGNFLWEDKKLTFLPLTPLEKNIDYIISLTAEARDTDGLSLDESFNCYFTTRAANERPEIISCFPSMYEDVIDPRAEVMIEFSMPVPLNSLYENVSFSPSMSGFWLLENDGKTAVFTPSEPWIANNRYEIRVSPSFTDINGMNIKNEYKSVFTAGAGGELPRLLHAYRITKDNELFQLTPDKGFSGASESPSENDGWEKDDRLLFIFSKSVDSLSVKNYLSAENGPALIMETKAGFETEIIFRFEKIPVYKSRFTIKIKSGIKDSAGNLSKEEYIFKVFAGGKFSKPPELAGIRIPMAPQNKTDCELIFISADSPYKIIPIKEENYPSGEVISTWIELCFETAESASIDIFSVMELFRIETSNNVITFSPRYVKTSNINNSEPNADAENYQRIEIHGNLVNSTNYGIINFQITAGLKDSLGNHNDKSFTIPVIK